MRPRRLHGDPGVVRELLPQREQQRQCLLEVAGLAQGDRLGQPVVRPHATGFRIDTQVTVTPSGIVSSWSSIRSNPYVR